MPHPRPPRHNGCVRIKLPPEEVNALQGQHRPRFRFLRKPQISAGHVPMQLQQEHSWRVSQRISGLEAATSIPTCLTFHGRAQMYRNALLFARLSPVLPPTGSGESGPASNVFGARGGHEQTSPISHLPYPHSGPYFFRTLASSHSRNPTDIVWRRQRPGLFAQRPVVCQNPRAEDVKQGEAGDCWFMSAVSVIATRPDLVRALFLDTAYNPHGAYAVGT